MLREIKKDIKENYFDPTFRGVDLDTKFKEADEQVRQAASGDQIYGIIAHTLLALEDSHTYFISPAWSLRVEYGWRMKIIGDKCHVVSVEPGSDAEAQGVKPGDLILSIFDIPPTRNNLSEIEYLFYRLRPLRAMRVVIQRPGGQPRRLDLATKVTKVTEESMAKSAKDAAAQSLQRYYDVSGRLFIWRMPDFNLPEKALDEMMRKATGYNTLVLDLRDNGGGYNIILQRLVGYFFDQDVVVSEGSGRKGSKPLVAKTRGSKIFKGQLIVLADSRTGSAAEMFARVMQLEKRGTVIGDRTAGRVMSSLQFYHPYRFAPDDPVGYLYGVSVTVQEHLMGDGKSLEGAGVIPDEVILPTSSDIAAKRDPVLSRAAELAGVKLDPQKAGALPWAEL